MPRWLKIILKSIAGIILFMVLLIFGLMLYITYNKAKVLGMVNSELNTNMNGKVTIGDMRPRFFKGFPNISLALKNVVVRDNRFNEHHHTLLDAKDFDISVNIRALLTGTIGINHIEISNARIDLFTDSTGYSNTSIFKKTNKKTKKDNSKSESSTELEKFSLVNVQVTVNDLHKSKLFNFIANDIHGNISHPDTGWHTNFHMDVTAKSMAFNTKHGSFIRNKGIEGDLAAGYNDDSGKINVQANDLDISDDPFKVDAVFATAGDAADFSIHLVQKGLLWKHASSLLSNNIQQKLNMFDIDKPIVVTAVIKGSFGGGDPYLYVTAKVEDSKVSTPGGSIENCSFNGVFTNSYQKNKDFSDENSVIRLVKLTGTYSHVPFSIDTGSIINLTTPIATGNFRANFSATDLNYLFGAKVAKFSKGVADMRLKYKADIVNYQLNKPIITGTISVKNADIRYIPENLLLNNCSASLFFVGDDLLLRNIRLQTGRSVVTMEGQVNNFLNLYYSAPEKILLTWKIRSPQIYLGEFLGFLSDNGSNNGFVANKQVPAVANKGNSGNVINQLSTVLQKSHVAMQLDIDNVHYFKFLATDVHADLLTTENGVIIKNVGAKNSGGFLKLSGSVKREQRVNKISLNTVISKVDVRNFFYDFDNFGLKDFTYENLKGLLSAKTQITATITDKAALVPGSMNGTLDINLQQGSLINFKPLDGVAKFAFPFRNLKNITIPSLDAHFDVKGDKIIIHPMKFSSSVLNMDVAGVYGLNKGTNIALDIPLRNPKKDTTIHDEEKLMKKRYKGIVLHVLAKADSTGKVKFGFNKDRNKDEADKQQLVQ